MSNLQLEEYPWKRNFSNYTKFKQKTLNYIERPFRNFHFEVAVWRHFSIVSRAIWHCLLYNVQFSIRGVPMEAKLVKLNPNWNEKPLTRSKNLLENLSLKLLCDVVFPSLPGQSDILTFCQSDNLLYNVQFSIRGVHMETKFLQLHQIKTRNIQLDPKTFQNILLWSWCLTLFFCRCPANLTFFALQCPIFNQMSTHGSQTSQIYPNWNRKPLTRSKGLLENHSFKLLCDVNFPLLPGQSDAPFFKITNFPLDDYFG